MSESKEILIVDLAKPAYLPPFGTPLNWRREQGDLPAAVKRFINHEAHPDRYEAPTASQLKLVIDFLRYFIGAPCWDGPVGAIRHLREQAEAMSTIAEVGSFIGECLKLNIDPF